MAQAEGRSDAYLEAREAALSWLNANWNPGADRPGLVGQARRLRLGLPDLARSLVRSGDVG